MRRGSGARRRAANGRPRETCGCGGARSLSTRGEPKRSACNHGGVLAAVGGEHDIDAERRGGGNGNGRPPPSVFHSRFLAPSLRKNPTLVVPYRTWVRHDDTTEATTMTPRDNRNQDRDHNRHD